MTEKVNAGDAGCWIDGHWGQYGVARMIQIAAELGFTDELGTELNPTHDVVDIARRHLASAGPSDSPGIDDDEHEVLSDAVDDVVDWMNENVVPPGFSFGWYDGEFFLQSDEWWSDESV